MNKEEEILIGYLVKKSLLGGHGKARRKVRNKSFSETTMRCAERIRSSKRWSPVIN